MLGIGIGKVAANIPHGRRPQQRVGDGVQQHIRVGVAQQAQRVVDDHAAHHQGATGHQGMYVPTLANAHHRGHVYSLCVGVLARAANTASANAKSAG